MKIRRTLFWFNEGDERLHNLTADFFGLATMLNRLMNEKYDGKRIRFINIYYANEQTYQLYPKRLKEESHFYNGLLSYYELIDYNEFNKLPKSDQFLFLWNSAYDCIRKASKNIKNESLSISCKYAYNKGLELNLNPDYRVLEAEVMLFGETLLAAVWILFRDDKMYSKFKLEKKGKVLFEQDIDSSGNAIEFFLEIYKKIELVGQTIIIKGVRDVDYLPLRIKIEKSMLTT